MVHRFSTARSIVFIAGTLLLSGSIMLFPLLSSNAQKVKKKMVGEQQSDSARNKPVVVNSRDLDQAIADLDKVNLDSISWSIRTALESIDFDAIGHSVETALRSVNTDSMRQQIQSALKNIDFQKMQAEIDKATTEMKKSNWQKEMQAGLKEAQESLQEVDKINVAAIRKEMKGVQKELENARKEMAAAQINVKSDMVRAKAEIETARAEMVQLKNLLADMQKDGLIKDGKNIQLEWKNGRLLINGKEQSAEVSRKYESLQNIHLQLNRDDDKEDSNEL